MQTFLIRYSWHRGLEEVWLKRWKIYEQYSESKKRGETLELREGRKSFKGKKEKMMEERVKERWLNLETAGVK